MTSSSTEEEGRSTNSHSNQDIVEEAVANIQKEDNGTTRDAPFQKVETATTQIPSVASPRPSPSRQPSNSSKKRSSRRALNIAIGAIIFVLFGSAYNVMKVHNNNVNVNSHRQEWLRHLIEQHYVSSSVPSNKSIIDIDSRTQMNNNTTTNTNTGVIPDYARNDPNFIPLTELVLPSIPKECPTNSKLFPVPIQSNPIADLNEGYRKIPRIVHQTGKVGCVTKPFYEGALQWTFPNHSFYFHDDEAVDKLLFERDWPEFPQLSNTFKCLKYAGGAAKADLWRYVALWEYGGIYTDMDNLPNKKLQQGNSIRDDMDAYFLQERGGWMSQYFFAVSPKHPLMFLAVHDVMEHIHDLLDIGNLYVPVETGPGSIKRAFLKFMGKNESWDEEMTNTYAKPNRGLYIGAHYENKDGSVKPNARSVYVEGRRLTNQEWVIRTAIRGKDKNDGFKAMNITSYHDATKHPKGISCLQYLYETHQHRQTTTSIQP